MLSRFLAQSYQILLWLNFKQSQATLFYPSNTAYGIFAAIAVPLDLPNRNVFVSYNFEANYDLPENWSLPSYASNLTDEDLFVSQTRDCLNCTLNERNTNNSNTNRNFQNHQHEKRDTIPSLLTRQNFYHILAHKFQSNGFESGTNCLLRLICEVNASSFDMLGMNGILGHLLHILFSPTASRNENLSSNYYKAEWHGKTNKCQLYEKLCKESILDLITVPLHDIIDKVLKEENLIN